MHIVLHGTVEELSTLRRVTASQDAVIAELRKEMTSGIGKVSSSTLSQSRKRSSRDHSELQLKVRANDLTQAKNAIHQVYWQLMNVSRGDHSELLRHNDEDLGPNPSLGNPCITEADGSLRWQPAWSSTVDKPVNVKFLKEVARQIYEEEKVCTYFSFRSLLLMLCLESSQYFSAHDRG
ncbi:hypothetical protein BDY19DRAFT_409233 [Irpex rosettiformis]|uniref:Uncharacterized protein n=1 Tax=Irpex rosettiformis TaxID=378272 RepID=A0ACB8UFS8_9APHY|nr:hypothetical protein BDY19DRAFT_409233 [Irpex rosettiformis]